MHHFVPLVDPDDLPSDLRAQWDATTRPGLRDFIRIMGHAPDHSAATTRRTHRCASTTTSGRASPRSSA